MIVRYIWIDGKGKAPVPNVCPQCGYHAKRHGNRSSQTVRCTNPQGALVCGWAATVFYEKVPS